MPTNKRGYMNEYIKANVVYRRINFSVKNLEDMQMVQWLDSREEGIAQYVKGLIRQDIRRTLSTRKESPAIPDKS